MQYIRKIIPPINRIQAQAFAKHEGGHAILPLERRLEAFKRFQQLSARGKSRRELVLAISRQFGLSQETVYGWVRGTSPFGTRCGTIWYSKGLFYVIGALLGDGCVYHWRNTFQIWLVGEPEFCDKYARMASLVCKHSRRSFRKPIHYKARPWSGKNAWFVHFQNAELFFLIKQMRERLDLLTELLRRGDRRANGLQLIEGFFDAEGCIKIIKEPVRKTPKINIDFCNTNLALLQLIGYELKVTMGIEPHFSSQVGRGNRKTSHHLRIYKKESIRKFLTYISTIKLKPDKRPYVENWLSKNRRKEREGPGLFTSLPYRTSHPHQTN